MSKPQTPNEKNDNLNEIAERDGLNLRHPQRPDLGYVASTPGNQPLFDTPVVFEKAGHPERVVRESEKIQEAMLKILTNSVKYDVGGEAFTDHGAAAKALSRWMMEYTHEDWSKSVRHGIALGHKDVVTMLEALVEQAEDFELSNGSNEGIYPNEVVRAVPLSELQKVIKAVKKTEEAA